LPGQSRSHGRRRVPGPPGRSALCAGAFGHNHALPVLARRSGRGRNAMHAHHGRCDVLNGARSRSSTRRPLLTRVAPPPHSAAPRLDGGAVPMPGTRRHDVCAYSVALALGTNRCRAKMTRWGVRSEKEPGPGTTVTACAYSGERVSAQVRPGATVRRTPPNPPPVPVAWRAERCSRRVPTLAQPGSCRNAPRFTLCLTID
jgi:hypothetical protein